MKAALFHGLGHALAIETVADPTPAPDEVIVGVARCGICGSDLHITASTEFAPPPGSVLGHEYAGEVLACGRDVRGLATGDRVAVIPARSCGHCHSCAAGEPVWCDEMRIMGGGFAQFAPVKARECVRLPNDVSVADGALVEPLAVALNAVELGSVGPRSRVLVLGAGPIGLAVTFWAARLGAARIAVAATSKRRAELAFTFGAHEFLDPAEPMDLAVQRAFGGAPDVVFECVGKPGMLERAVQCARRRGTVVLVGLCVEHDSLHPATLLVKQVRIQPAMMYGVRHFEEAADALAASQAMPRAMVTDTVSLASLPAAFEALRTRSTQCKVLVDPHAALSA